MELNSTDNNLTGEIIKELFAHFGRAYYYSECLHRQLCNMYVLGTFRSSSDATRPRVEEKLVYTFSLTLGKVFEDVKNIIPEEIYPNIEEAIEKRNFLAHYFWYEKIHLLYSTESIQQLIDELSDYADFFHELDEILVSIFEPYMIQFGIDDEVIQKHMKEVACGIAPPPLTKKRKLKKREKIINAYIVPPENALIFQTDDNELLQLCDIGLGWSNRIKPENNWAINQVIQKYLPIEINPRPQINEPWNYELKLGYDKALWIKVENNIIRWCVKILPI
jgi:hypothetical protein